MEGPTQMQPESVTDQRSWRGQTWERERVREAVRQRCAPHIPFERVVLPRGYNLKVSSIWRPQKHMMINPVAWNP